MARTIHIIGAGLAGLAAAVALTKRGRPNAASTSSLHEATTFAGGRCRSYHDAALDMTIDNGNHLLLSGNRAALAFLRDIGAAQRLPLPPEAAFDFIDLKSRERWTAAHERRPGAVVDIRFRQARSRHPRASIISSSPRSCFRPPASRSARSSIAAGRSMSA